jgi:integrase
MPRLSPHPIPKKRFHGGRWRIYWKWNKRQYSIATEYMDAKKTSLVNNDLRLISAALAMDDPEFPTVYQEAPAVLMYLAVRWGDTQAPSDPAAWLMDYEKEIMSDCDFAWARDSLTRLRNLETAMDGLGNVTPSNGSAYLAGIGAKRSTGTRNRALTAFNRFFKWAMRTGRTKINPFAGITALREERRLDIVYCTVTEREAIIDMAKATGWPEWLAVAIAFYAGMRREEISNLLWSDIRVGEGLIIVTKTKTKTSRTLPLASKLEEMLVAVPQSERIGYVVKSPEGLDRLWRLNTLIKVIQKAKQAQLMEEWKIQKPVPSRSKQYPGKKAEYLILKEKRKAELQTHLERIGWNPWRHTFGSLLAQAGVSLDKISAWMGNTPEVCRRHYAQFIPRDRRDGEIDKL